MEAWYDIPGFEGYYQINRNQQIRSIDRLVEFGIYKKRVIRKGVIRKHVVDQQGYPRVNLSKLGKTKLIGVHRLMAITFIPTLENKPHINHINGIKTDNRVENLEWCTAAENNRHAWKSGLNRPITGEKHWLHGKKGPNAGKYGEQLKQTKILLDTQTGIFYYGAKEAADAKSININNLRAIMTGRQKNTTNLIYV